MAANLSQAEERAYDLLLQHLTPEQRDTFHEQGYVEFTARGGRLWRLYTHESLIARESESYGVLVEWARQENTPNAYVNTKNVWVTNGRYGDSYGADIPECDQILSLKVVMEALGSPPAGCSGSMYWDPLNKKLSPGTLTKYNF